MLILQDRPDPVFLYAGANAGRHLWLGILTPRALQLNAGSLGRSAARYSEGPGQGAIDAVLKALAEGTGGVSARSLTRKLNNGIRASLSLHKHFSFMQALNLHVPQGLTCLAFRQVLDEDGRFTWSVDPLQGRIDPDSGKQRVGDDCARFTLNEMTRVYVACCGLYRSWHVRVLG